MSDEEIIAELTKIKGIGRWTAEMILIFRLARPDILPVGRSWYCEGDPKGLRAAKNAGPERMQKIGERGARIARWHPGICGPAWRTRSHEEQRSRCCWSR